MPQWEGETNMKRLHPPSMHVADDEEMLSGMINK